jgi:pyruvate/2-oxoacid:ferredoxin oxidoreductase alpha subunit
MSDRLDEDGRGAAMSATDARSDAAALRNGDGAVLLTGNHAVAWAARLARPRVVPVYPITPQTPVLEKLTDFQAEGSFDAQIITPESEHSVMSACIPASLAGVRVFTATASQGLLLMHELLHYASGARAPIVMANVNRTVASPWAFWPDQTDSLAQRDTGWIQFYVESAQEALDTVIQAFRVAEQALLPALVNLDAFYVSHSLEPVCVPEQALVDAYLPPLRPEHRLDTAQPSSWGNVVTQDMYRRHREEIEIAMAGVAALAAEADREWAARTGRSHGVLERYRCDGAGIIIVAMGSLCGTVREAVDLLRESGVAAGLLKLRLFRPLPASALRAALAGIGDVVVLDRDHSPGSGGVLHQELRAALYGLPDAPRVHGCLAGVGGVNVSPATIVSAVRRALSSAPSPESEWLRPAA